MHQITLCRSAADAGGPTPCPCSEEQVRLCSERLHAAVERERATTSPRAQIPFSIQVVQTRGNRQLLSYDFLMAIADAINLLGLSRMRTTDWLADKIYSWSGHILDGQGGFIPIDDESVDRAYGKDEGGTWNSNVKVFAARRPRRKPAQKMILRFLLWDAAFKIAGRPIRLPED